MSGAGPGQEQGRNRAGAGPSKARGGQEQDKSRAGTKLSRVEQSRAERGQEQGRNWGGASNLPDRSLKGAGQEYGRGRAKAGAGEELIPFCS